MYIITVLLLVSLCLASGQRTDVPLDSCTYSFVVQSPHCWRGGNTGWESEVAILKETVASLSDRLEDVDQTMQELKKGTSTAVDAPRPAPLTATVDDRTVYVYIGCPRDININIVHFVPLSLQPSAIRVISVNFSETDNGQRVLLTPTMSPFPVFCTIDKYITIQRRRFPSIVSFNRTWDQYKTGFGDISGDFWLGLEKLYQITSQPHVRYSLRLEMKLNTGVHYYSEYKDFHIADESRKYMLVSIGKKMASNVNYFLKVGSIFATPDKDQKYKCGTRYNGFWYYENANSSPIGCSFVRFNADGIPLWHPVTGNTELTEMKIRLQDV